MRSRSGARALWLREGLAAGPRDDAELEIVYGLVVEPYRNAGGRALPDGATRLRASGATLLRRYAAAAPATRPTR